MFESEEMNLRQIYDLLWSNKWVLIRFVLICVLLGLLYSLFCPRIYTANGLVQVEDQSKNSGLAALTDLSSMLTGNTVETEAEIQILQSRMVLGQVVEKRKLLVGVTPRFFPVIGAAITRWNKDRIGPASAPPGLGAYAWGGERIVVPTFDVPESWVDNQFKLIATKDGYILEDEKGRHILTGVVGSRAIATLPQGEVAMFVRELSARPGTEFFLVRRSLQGVIDYLTHNLTVAEQGKQSGVILLKFKGSSPEESSEVINDIQEAYVRQNVERRSAEAEQSLEFLSKQLPDLKVKVELAQTNLNNYQLQHGTVDVAQETQQVLQQTVALDSQRLELEQQREQALQRFTSNHPVVKSLDDQIRLMQGEQEKMKKGVEKLPTTQQDILSLMRDVDVSTQLYTTMLNTIQELQVTKAGTIGNVRIIDSALKPNDRSSPQTRVVMALALAIGLALGCGYLFLVRALLRGVDDPAQVESIWGLSTFATIPYSPLQKRLSRTMARKGSVGGKYVLAASADDPAVSEALRSLRTALHFALIESPNNVIMITGPTVGLGKSFVSTNLASVLALSGKKVALVDADLRRGHVNHYFSQEPTPGVTDFLAGDADEPSIIRASTIDGLDYVARGTIPPNPAELLMNDRFSAFVQRLSERYDHVILDSPPVLPVTDAAIIGRLAGCTLLILKSAEHPVREIDDAIRRLSNARINVRGVIFNQVGAKIASYGYGNYNYSYTQY